MAKITITMPGGFSTTVDYTKFGGGPWAEPNLKLPLGTWNNWSTSVEAARSDANKCYDMISEHIVNMAYSGVIVIGHSRATQVMNLMFREKYADMLANFDPSRLLFIGSGDPEHEYNGASVVNPEGDPATYPGTGGFRVGYSLPPTNTGVFRMLKISRQYDRFADYPNDINNEAALDKIFGDAPHGDVISNNGYHGDYTTTVPALNTDGFPVNWDQWTWWDATETLTYLVSAEPSTVAPEPPSSYVRFHEGKAQFNRVRQAQYLDSLEPEKAAVEAGYTRPVPVWAQVAV